ncbi:MAG: type IV-A pilus assembly ATPase PilB [bacterium]
MKARLGEILIQANVITQEQLNKALEEQKKSGGRVAHNLIKLGFLKEEDALYHLSKQLGVPCVDLRNFNIDNDILGLIPTALVKKYSCIPLNQLGDTLTVAFVDPTDYIAIEDISFSTGFNIETVLTTESLFLQAYNQYYKKSVSPDLDVFNYEEEEEEQGQTKKGISSKTIIQEESKEDLTILMDFDKIVKGALENVEVVETDIQQETLTEADAPIVKLVNGILLNAVNSKASDIHIEPYEKSFRVRFRLDGVLKKIMGLPPKIKNAVVSRIKIMAKLDIAEKRLPQDGRIKLKLGKNSEMDFRVSVLPTLYGEKVVLRLLDKSNLQLDMTKLGFEPESLEKFQNAIQSPYGMILVTGPTGSGKTTTLYSALHQLNKEGTNIMTAEDPVEFNLQGINQVQVHENIGLTFASALRSFLRQDPDVIMVGEIRDLETAEIGVKAALTGHLMLSTLHTNDAPSTIVRLLNMGVESFLVSSAVVLVLSQRLVRRICSNCREKTSVPVELLKRIGFSDQDLKAGPEIYKGKGCPKCSNTGYKGRLALYEVMLITDPVKEMIVRGGSTEQLRALAREEGMKTLRESGLQKIKEGLTTLEEVFSVSV